MTVRFVDLHRVADRYGGVIRVDMDRLEGRFAEMFADVVEEGGPDPAAGFLHVLFGILECHADREHA
jgi:hypothetical protein